MIVDNSSLTKTAFQKHLGVILDAIFTFDDHLNSVLSKINKTIGLLRRLQKNLSRPALMTIYKALYRLH